MAHYIGPIGPSRGGARTMAHCIGPLVPPEEEEGASGAEIREHQGLKLVPVLGYKRAYYMQHRNPSGPDAWRSWLENLKL